MKDDINKTGIHYKYNKFYKIRKFSNFIFFVNALFFVFSIPSQAKKLNNDFEKYGFKCWVKNEKNDYTGICFRKNMSIGTSTAKFGDAFSNEGIFRFDNSKIYILGFPGNGWPTKNKYNECNYYFSDEKSTLMLNACELSGTWKQSETSNITGE